MDSNARLQSLAKICKSNIWFHSSLAVPLLSSLSALKRETRSPNSLDRAIQAHCPLECVYDVQNRENPYMKRATA